jgi:hypothetical protein
MLCIIDGRALPAFFVGAITNFVPNEKSLKALPSKAFENHPNCSDYLRNVGAKICLLG